MLKVHSQKHMTKTEDRKIAGHGIDSGVQNANSKLRNIKIKWVVLLLWINGKQLFNIIRPTNYVVQIERMFRIEWMLNTCIMSKVQQIDLASSKLE